MKIPVYQKQISYRAAPVKEVKLAQPLAQASTADKWERIQLASQLAMNGGKVYQQLANTFKKSSRPAPDASVSAASNPETVSLSSGFADPARAELLAFGRKASLEPSKESASAIEKLDDYFGAQWQQAQSQGANADTHLLAQDYVVLRQEMKHLMQQQQQQARAEAFAQGAATFVQNAALVRTAGALEDYIQTNLQAAQEQAKRDGLTGFSAAQQQAALRSQAVTHNLDAALQAGELDQAEQVYGHFKEQLSAVQQQLAEAQLLQARAQQMARQDYAALQLQAEQTAHPLTPKQLQAWAQEQYKQEPALASQVAQQLQMHLAAQQRRQWQMQADYYEQCLQSPTDVSATPAGQNAQQYRFSQQLLTAVKQGETPHTSATEFMQLYTDILQGNPSQQDIEKAYQNGQVSAQDALRLEYCFCRKQANGADPREQLLLSTFDRYCQQSGLSVEQTAQAQYTVFAAGTQWADKWSAAQEVKQIIQLQEKKK